MMPGAFPIGSVAMGVCKKRILGSIAQGTATLLVPADYNSNDNVWGALGSGGDGGNGSAGIGGGGGAGAGAIAWKWQIALEQDDVIPVQVGGHGATNKTIFDTANNTVVADYGRSSSGATKGVGGATANSTGTVKFKGGDGSDSGNLLSGGGSGGAPDFVGAGGDATAPSGVSSGGGGTNGQGLAGGAPVTTTAVGNNGAAGKEWDGIEGSGSGASGAGGISGIGAADNGATGGLYGAGGSGGNTSLSGSNGGAGKDGRIWYHYYPISNANVIFFRRPASQFGARVGTRQVMH